MHKISLRFFALNLLTLISFSIQGAEGIVALKSTFHLRNSTTLVISQGDITKAHVAAIVHPANKNLTMEAGISTAIFNAAGIIRLSKACDALIEEALGGIPICDTGEALITSSCNLANTSPIKDIIHTVGPDCKEVTDEAQQNYLLIATYHNCLRLAEEHGITSIAFPSISTGNFAFPKERAAKNIWETFQAYCMTPSCLREIHCVFPEEPDYRIMETAVLAAQLAQKKID